MLAPAILVAVALGSGCTPETGGDAERGSAPSERTAEAPAPLVGVDGPLTVNAADTVVNQYAVLAANAAH